MQRRHQRFSLGTAAEPRGARNRAPSGWAATATPACRLTATPEAWWWEGPDGKRTLVWSGKHVLFRLRLFHAPGVAARGRSLRPRTSGTTRPRPAKPGIPRKEDLAAAEQVLRRKLAKMGHYRHPVVAFQVTNMWRMDNDPPSRQIGRLRQGLERQRAKTPAGDVHAQPVPGPVAGNGRRQITTVRRGDWQDWWSDGLARRRNCWSPLSRPSGCWPICRPRRGCWVRGRQPDGGPLRRGVARCHPLRRAHLGSYWSIAQPYHRCGHWRRCAEKAVLACRAAERAAGPHGPAAQGEGLLRFLPHPPLPRAESRRRRRARDGSRSPPPPSASPATPRASWPPARRYPLEDVREPDGPTPTRRARRSTFPTTFGAGK